MIPGTPKSLFKSPESRMKLKKSFQIFKGKRIFLKAFAGTSIILSILIAPIGIIDLFYPLLRAEKNPRQKTPVVRKRKLDAEAKST